MNTIRLNRIKNTGKMNIRFLIPITCQIDFVLVKLFYFFLYFETRVLLKWIRFYVEAAENCVKHWYSEEKNYKYKTPESPDNKRFASQFTQLVWNSSSELGGGITYYQYYEDVIFHCVALYYPEGNIKGSYGANVFCKLTEPNCKKKAK